MAGARVVVAQILLVDCTSRAAVKKLPRSSAAQVRSAIAGAS
jgi:hypothetical protein